MGTYRQTNDSNRCGKDNAEPFLHRLSPYLLFWVVVLTLGVWIQPSLASDNSVVHCLSAFYIFTLAWGFRRCSFRLVGPCESLYSVERVTEQVPRFFVCISEWISSTRESVDFIVYGIRMNILQNNPYRQLGVYSNSPTKERLANHNLMKAFLKVGKSVFFLYWRERIDGANYTG